VNDFFHFTVNDVARHKTMDSKELVGQLDEMLAELRALCPAICPSVVPAGYDDRFKGTALAALYGKGGAEKAERAALADVLERARRGRTECQLTGQAVASESQLRFVSFWDLEPTTGAMKLRDCAFVSLETALLLDPLLMMERFAAPETEAAELGGLASRFCMANGREELCAKPARALEW